MSVISTVNNRLRLAIAEVKQNVHDNARQLGKPIIFHPFLPSRTRACPFSPDPSMYFRLLYEAKLVQDAANKNHLDSSQYA